MASSCDGRIAPCPALGARLAVLISILSPVRDEARYIDEMVRSVLAQTHTDWELLFVDDGSADETPRKIAEAAARDARIRVVARGGRPGKVAAFNAAYAASRGPIIILLSGDDTLPRDSLQTRRGAFAAADLTAPVVAFFKIRTISEDPREHGRVIPRGPGPSFSGGSITLTRPLAEALFPIEPDLVAEDLWLGWGARGMAERVYHSPAVVLNYRIHDGNSNPRHLPFGEMTEALHVRYRAWESLLRTDRLSLTPAVRAQVDALWTAECLRRSKRTLALLFLRGLPLVKRLEMVSISTPTWFATRRRALRVRAAIHTLARRRRTPRRPRRHRMSASSP